MSIKGQESVEADPRKLRGGRGGGGGETRGPNLGGERAPPPGAGGGPHPPAAGDDAILPLLCRGSPLTRHPQLLVHLLPTSWILSSHSSTHSVATHVIHHGLNRPSMEGD